MNAKPNLEKYGFSEKKDFDTDRIILDQAVRNMCRQNTCGQYGKNHMCPPAVKGLDEWRKDIAMFRKGIIVTKAYTLKNKYDIRGMFEGALDFHKELAQLKEEVESLYPHDHFLFLGAGACTICKECAYKEDEPCRFPEKAFPSLEACGIDVMSLSKSAGVKYNNGENTVTYIGAILYA